MSLFKIEKTLNNFIKNLKKHNIQGYAIQCAYYTILSFIPFIILLFSLIQHTSIKKESLFFLAEQIIPGNIYSLIESILKEASFKSIGTLSFSAIILIWSAGKGFFALSRGFNHIYEISDKQNYWFLKLKSIICILFFILFTVGILFLIAFSNTLTDLIKEKFNKLSNVLTIILNLRVIWQYLILFFAFLLMYKYVPNYNVKLKNQIPGALFSAISWYTLSYVFSVYLKLFKNFSVIYGSLTSIILLMIWVYLCMYAVLVGVEINAFFLKGNNN